MFLTSAIGSRLSARFTVRALVRAGLTTTLAAALLLLVTVQPALDDSRFAMSMALLGVGMGLIVSQLGNVVQSSVDASGRSEAGGMQYTGQQLGSSLGVALIGAIVLTGLGAAFVSNVEDDPRVSSEVSQMAAEAAKTGDFVSADQVRKGAEAAGLDAATTDAVVEGYEEAQLQSLKVGLLAAAFLALGSLAFTRDLPHEASEVPARAAGPVPAET
jgi:hypothetical protein